MPQVGQDLEGRLITADFNVVDDEKREHGEPRSMKRVCGSFATRSLSRDAVPRAPPFSLEKGLK